MVFNMNDAYNFLNNVLKTDNDIKSSISKLISYCKDNYDSDCWNKIGKIDFEKDKRNLEGWIKNNITSSIINDKSIDTLWFGLFQGIVNDNEIYQLYVTAAEKFDEDDYETLEIENEGYFDSAVLYDISIILEKQQTDIKQIGEYVLVLGLSCIIIKEIVKSEGISHLLKEHNINEVVVGFDSGDYIIL